jgi:hypothetical protein
MCQGPFSDQLLLTLWFSQGAQLVSGDLLLHACRCGIEPSEVGAAPAVSWLVTHFMQHAAQWWQMSEGSGTGDMQPRCCSSLLPCAAAACMALAL